MNQQDHDNRSKALHMFVVRKIQENPALWDEAIELLARWRSTACVRSVSSLEEWKSIIESGQSACFQFMVESSERADRLRQSSPFSCLLTTSERLKFINDWRLSHEKERS